MRSKHVWPKEDAQESTWKESRVRSETDLLNTAPRLAGARPAPDLCPAGSRQSQSWPVLHSPGHTHCLHIRTLLARCHLSFPKVTLPWACLLQNYTCIQPLLWQTLPNHPAQGQPSQAPGSCPLQLHQTLCAPSSTWHSDIPLKKLIPEYKTVAWCQGTALGSGVPFHDPIFRAQAPGAGTHTRITAAWGCGCIWAPGRSQRGQDPTVPGAGRKSWLSRDAPGAHARDSLKRSWPEEEAMSIFCMPEGLREKWGVCHTPQKHVQKCVWSWFTPSSSHPSFTQLIR